MGLKGVVLEVSLDADWLLCWRVLFVWAIIRPHLRESLWLSSLLFKQRAFQFWKVSRMIQVLSVVSLNQFKIYSISCVSVLLVGCWQWNCFENKDVFLYHVGNPCVVLAYVQSGILWIIYFVDTVRFIWKLWSW